MKSAEIRGAQDEKGPQGGRETGLSSISPEAPGRPQAQPHRPQMECLTFPHFDLFLLVGILRLCHCSSLFGVGQGTNRKPHPSTLPALYFH